MTITELKNKVGIAAKGIEPETARIILKFEQQILDIVRENQLYDKGIDGKGKALQPYAAYTVAYKRSVGQKTSNTTLEDSGNFYRSFQTDYGSFELEIFATDAKTPDIVKKYGNNLFEMTPQSLNTLSETIIRPNLIKYLEKILR